MKKITKRIAIIVGVIVIIALVAFGIYVNIYYHGNERAIKALDGTDEVTVSAEDNRLVFQPKDQKVTTGLIFYPGAKVEYSAYAPLMTELAKKGYLCVVTKMPCNLAIFGQGKADDVISDYKDIEHWFVGGHSLGGVMAAKYAKEHIDQVEGVVFLASYSTENLSETNLSAISIYGTKDGILNMDQVVSCRKNMPEDYAELKIQGGNHAQFGDYGQQKGDQSADVTVEEQQEFAANAIGQFMGEKK